MIAIPGGTPFYVNSTVKRDAPADGDAQALKQLKIAIAKTGTDASVISDIELKSLATVINKASPETWEASDFTRFLGDTPTAADKATLANALVALYKIAGEANQDEFDNLYAAVMADPVIKGAEAKFEILDTAEDKTTATKMSAPLKAAVALNAEATRAGTEALDDGTTKTNQASPALALEKIAVVSNGFSSPVNFAVKILGFVKDGSDFTLPGSTIKYTEDDIKKIAQAFLDKAQEFINKNDIAGLCSFFESGKITGPDNQTVSKLGDKPMAFRGWSKEFSPWLQSSEYFGTTDATKTPNDMFKKLLSDIGTWDETKMGKPGFPDSFQYYDSYFVKTDIQSTQLQGTISQIPAADQKAFATAMYNKYKDVLPAGTFTPGTPPTINAALSDQAISVLSQEVLQFSYIKIGETAPTTLYKQIPAATQPPEITFINGAKPSKVGPDKYYKLSGATLAAVPAATLPTDKKDVTPTYADLTKDPAAKVPVPSLDNSGLAVYQAADKKLYTVDTAKGTVVAELAAAKPQSIIGKDGKTYTINFDGNTIPTVTVADSSPAAVDKSGKSDPYDMTMQGLRALVNRPEQEQPTIIADTPQIVAALKAVTQVKLADKADVANILDILAQNINGESDLKLLDTEFTKVFNFVRDQQLSFYKKDADGKIVLDAQKQPVLIKKTMAAVFAEDGKIICDADGKMTGFKYSIPATVIGKPDASLDKVEGVQAFDPKTLRAPLYDDKSKEFVYNADKVALFVNGLAENKAPISDPNKKIIAAALWDIINAIASDKKIIISAEMANKLSVLLTAFDSQIIFAGSKTINDHFAELQIGKYTVDKGYDLTDLTKTRVVVPLTGEVPVISAISLAQTPDRLTLVNNAGAITYTAATLPAGSLIPKFYTVQKGSDGSYVLVHKTDTKTYPSIVLADNKTITDTTFGDKKQTVIWTAAKGFVFAAPVAKTAQIPTPPSGVAIDEKGIPVSVDKVALSGTGWSLNTWQAKVNGKDVYVGFITTASQKAALEAKGLSGLPKSGWFRVEGGTVVATKPQPAASKAVATAPADGTPVPSTLVGTIARESTTSKLFVMLDGVKRYVVKSGSQYVYDADGVKA